MNPETNPAPQTAMPNPLAVMQKDEKVICEIKRHPIGLIGMYVAVGFVIVVVAVLAFAVLPHFLTSYSTTKVDEIGVLILLITLVVTLPYVFIANKIYWDNRWILTSDSVTQVTRTGLFDRQSSQLSLGNLEDVTAEQDGPMAHMFKYGLLRIETAGERSKFVFPYCPNPTYFAQQVIAARENFEQMRRGSDAQRLYRDGASYQAPGATAPQATPQGPQQYAQPLPPQPPASDPQQSYPQSNSSQQTPPGQPPEA